MKRLVVLGGGYGGLKIIYGLLEEQLPEDIDITLIDRNPYHSVKTEFYTVAAGTAADIDNRENFPTNERLTTVYGEITKIDTSNEQILVDGKTDPIPYDYLVIGLGCEDNYHGVPGAEEFTHSVQTFSKARKTGMAVGNCRANGNVTIVGAGLSGIEVAAEIRESRSDLNIRLLDRGSSVLKAFDEKIQAHVADWFSKNGVNVFHHSNVEYVEKNGVCNNGLCYIDDVTIWTAGVRPNYLVRELPFEKDVQDKIVVNDYYQVPEQQNVYVVGDCASSEHSPSGQLAGQQGEQIIDVLAAVLTDKTPKKPKPIKLKGTLGSLGKSDGFGDMMQKSVTGYLPRLAKSGLLWLNKRH
ncbi:NAD(P)/FAD-dependent oxidoreductase [Virgibacillus ainsalahensis]